MSFRPAPATTLIAFSIAVSCTALAMWQVERMQQKQKLFKAFEEAPEYGYPQAEQANLPFTRVRTYGRFNDSWHVLIDNRVNRGRAGVHAISLFIPMSGKPFLVNRGWLPMRPDRLALPEVPTPTGSVEISGILSEVPKDGFRLGKLQRLNALEGQQLMTYLDVDVIADALDQPISGQLLLLDRHSPEGFEGRDWQPAVMLPAQHRAYAVQWFGLAIASLIGWFFLGRQRGQRRSIQGDNEVRPRR